MKISVKEPRALVGGDPFPYVWIEEEFLKRNLYPPKREEIARWVARSLSPEDLVEDLYRNLHLRTVIQALSGFRITRKSLSQDLFASIVERSEKGIIDLPKEEISRLVREAMSSLLSERLYGESDPVSLYFLLTTPPFSLFVLAWCDPPVDPLTRPSRYWGQLATGLERLMESRGGSFPRATALALFRRARESMKEERKRLSVADRARKDQEKAYREWIRSLWSAPEVRRALSLRPCELEDWILDGRIPVAIRIEFSRQGQLKERKLFDPEVIGAFSLKMVDSWREEREQGKRERRKKKPGPSKKPGRSARRKGPELT
jgi:hypothetical protein